MRTLTHSADGRPRWRAASAALALLATTLVTLTVSAAPAQASCAGYQVERTIWVGSAGAEATQVSPNNESCTRNRVYYGRVYDAVTDGSCVYAKFQDPIGTHFTQGIACTTGGWSNFTFWDQTGDSWALINVCTKYDCYYDPYPYGTPIWDF